MPPHTLVWTPTFKQNAKRFLKQHRDLIGDFSNVLHKLEQNANDPELRLHPLQGQRIAKHAGSTRYSYRIVITLVIADGEIHLHDVGSHDDVYC
ncbi:MAG: plasmid stabilization protein [Kiritimatiellae bacterium]|nr:plasmid stabilization protein [Kiritimatiellia bacterium]